MGMSSCQLRIHLKTLSLSHPSAIFADMFSLPSPLEINETCDGVPMIRMSDDVTDLSGIIRILYNPE